MVTCIRSETHADVNFFYATRVFHFTPLWVYFTSRSHGVKSQFCNLKHDKRKRIFSTHIFSIKKMDERKQLTLLISFPSSILTRALLLLQLQTVIALKILDFLATSWLSVNWRGDFWSFIIFAIRWFHFVQTFSKLFSLVSKEGPILIIPTNSFSLYVCSNFL